MKLVNFASLDPAHRLRGVKGLTGHSRNDEQVWNEFRDDWNKMAVLSETRLESLEARQLPTAIEPLATNDGPATWRPKRRWS